MSDRCDRRWGMDRIQIEIRRVLVGYADECIDENNEFHVPEEVLDEVALRIIPMDSSVLTDEFESGGVLGFDRFIKSLTALIFEEHKPYEVPEVAGILLARLRMSVEEMCDDFEPDIREVIEEQRKEGVSMTAVAEAARTPNVIMPFSLQMKILNEGIDRIIGTEDKK